MRQLREEWLNKVAAGKKAEDFYNEIIVPGAAVGGAAIAGAGGAVAGAIAWYGVEGFFQIAPDLMNALEELHSLSDEQVAEIMKNPYSYPD